MQRVSSEQPTGFSPSPTRTAVTGVSFTCTPLLVAPCRNTSNNVCLFTHSRFRTTERLRTRLKARPATGNDGTLICPSLIVLTKCARSGYLFCSETQTRKRTIPYLSTATPLSVQKEQRSKCEVHQANVPVRGSLFRERFV